MERQIIEWLQGNFPPRPPVFVGIGDDAACIEFGSRPLIITTDAIVDGVHFQTSKHSWRNIGHKAVAVNLSDLAAMGAVPIAIVVALVLPRETQLEQVQELYAGIRSLCDRWGVAIAGGDTNVANGPLAVSITAVGVPLEGRRPWLVSGAEVGDSILVSGSFGGSILGKHLTFEPRCDLARHVARQYEIHAATDVSDGLLFNLSVIARASACGALLALDSIPVSQDAAKMSDGQPALDHALYDGEDYELILVANGEQAARMLEDSRMPTRLTQIGRIDSGDGIRASQSDGSERPLPIRGYSHEPNGASR